MSRRTFLAGILSLLSILLLGYSIHRLPTTVPQAYALEACTPWNPLIPTPTGEPHPLRPNPNVACTSDVPNNARFSCATDLVVSKTIEENRGGPNCDNPDPYAAASCEAVFTVDADVNIGLSNLELPIAGVASNTAVSDNTSDSLRMLNYTSWYFQGALEQADQEPLATRVSIGGAVPTQGHAVDFSQHRKLMLLGDSITGGTQYPCALHDALEANPQTQGKIEFVGRQTSCVNQEGYGGYTTTRILNDVVTGAAALQPDIVLIHLGTNDVPDANGAFFGSVTVPNLRSIITKLRQGNPNVAIYLAQIIPMTDRPGTPANETQLVPELNTLIPAVADMNTGQSPVTIVDQNTGYDPVADNQADGLHPNATTGSQKIAAKFLDAMVNGTGGGNNGGNQLTPPTTLDTILSFSGPLKKLVSQDVFDKMREDIINAARGGSTYNQIIGYVDNSTNSVIGRKAALAYFKLHPAGTDIRKIRLSDMAPDHIKPEYDQYDPEKIKWYTLWRQVPFTQNTDVAGEVFATLPPPDHEGAAGIYDPTFAPPRLTFAAGTTLQDFKVNYPHLMEDNQLTKLAQSLFLPSGVQELGTDRDQSYQNLLNQDPHYFDNINRAAPWATQYCKPENMQTPWNPGDNLGSTRSLTGVFRFTKRVHYSYGAMSAAEIAKLPAGYTPKVSIEVSAPISIFARTPTVTDDIYDRLIKGPGSMYKALYPLEGEPPDWPTVAGLTFGSCGSQCTTKAANEAGRKPEIQFPHWGSILLFFHNRLQCMLDPTGAACGPNAQGGAHRPPIGSCVSYTPYSSDWSAIVDEAIARGGAAAHIPKGMLMAIHAIEGLTAYADPAYSCTKNPATALGLMQVTDSTYGDITSPDEQLDDEGVCAATPNKLSRCNPVDAVELAARVLLQKVGMFGSYSNYQPQGDITQKNEVYMSACRYYGSTIPDAATTDRAGDAWGPQQSSVALNPHDGKANYCEVVCARTDDPATGSRFCPNGDSYYWGGSYNWNSPTDQRPAVTDPVNLLP